MYEIVYQGILYTKVEGGLCIGREGYNYMTAVANSSEVNPQLILPKQVNGINVIKIAKYAFYQYTQLTSVDIQAQLTVLSKFCFSGSFNINFMRIPASGKYLQISNVYLLILMIVIIMELFYLSMECIKLIHL